MPAATAVDTLNERTPEDVKAGVDAAVTAVFAQFSVALRPAGAPAAK